MTRIAVVFPGDVSRPSTWSGTPLGIVQGLGELGVEVVNVSSSPPQLAERLLAGGLGVGYLPRAAGDAPLDRARSGYRAALIGPRLTRLRASIANRRLGGLELDGCVQIGASRPLDTRAPVATFEDMTVRQALAFPYDHWSTLRPADVEKRVEGQRLAYQAARACCVTNSWAARSVIEDYGVPADRVHVTGVGTNHAPRRVERDWSRPRFLFVGREWERKNGPAVVRCFAALREELPDAELHLVGQHPPVSAPGVLDHGPLRQDVADERGRLRELFDAATCFVMPSLFEPSAIVYTEAAAAGIPSIGTVVGGSEDLVGDGGVSVDPASDEQILAALRRFADPATARDAGARAAERSELFTWPKVAERLLRSLGIGDGSKLAEYLPAPG
jgi:hypothetical protein